MLKKHPYLQVLSLKETPVAIGIFSGKDYLITFANPLFCTVTGKSYQNVINKPLWHAIPEAQGQGFEKLLEGVLTTGIPYIGSETPVKLKRKGRLEVAYFSFVFNPLRNEEGQITDIMVIATEVTDKVLKEQAVESEREHFYNLLMQAPALIVIVKGSKHIIEFANPLAMQTMGAQQGVIGKSLIEVMPELKWQAFARILNNVYKTGKVFVGNEIPAMIDIGGTGVLEQRFYDFVYQPYTNNKGMVDGIFIHAVDVTEQVLARKKVKENEKHLWDIFESVSDAFVSYDNKWKYTYVNKEASKIMGKSYKELIGKVVWKVFPRLRNSEFGKNFLRVEKTKKPLFFQTFYSPLKKWFDVRIYPRKNGIATTFRDITKERKKQSASITKRDLKPHIIALKKTANAIQHKFVKIGDTSSAKHIEKITDQINQLDRLLRDPQNKK